MKLVAESVSEGGSKILSLQSGTLFCMLILIAGWQSLASFRVKLVTRRTRAELKG